jgi:hypothetical protein
MLQEYILDWNVKFQRKEYRLSVKQRSTCEYNGNHTGNIKRLLHDIFQIALVLVRDSHIKHWLLYCKQDLWTDKLRK